MKRTILYIIDSLEMGGAEIMLVSPLAEIHRNYDIIIVTLRPENDFTRPELICEKIYCLQMTSGIEILKAANKLKKIIVENKVTLVHSFLFWSNIVGRMACGKRTPYVFSLATIMTTGIYRHKWYSGYTRLLDQLTYKKNQYLISPSGEVLEDFGRSVGLKGKAIVLYNFVKEDFFKNELEYKAPTQKLKLVAVGNLKDVKNYQLIIDAFKLLKNHDISIDIYGEGPDREYLQKQISEYNLQIKLMGSRDKIYEVLPSYDAFVMCSLVEGFGISVAEAMTVGLPLLLSDINTLHEISHNNAVFFDPRNPQSFADAVIDIFNEEYKMELMSETGKKISKENYTKEKYLKGLLKVYDEVLE